MNIIIKPTAARFFFSCMNHLYNPVEHHAFCFIVKYNSYFSGGSRGGSGRLPFETKLLNFHGEFSENSGKIDK